MKKALSVFLAILMLAGCCCLFAAAEEVDLTGYVKLKNSETDVLADGDWYVDWDAYVGMLNDFAAWMALTYGSTDLNLWAFATDEYRAERKSQMPADLALWYCPENGNIYMYADGQGTLYPSDPSTVSENEDEQEFIMIMHNAYGRCIHQYHAPDAPTTDTPTTPDTPTNPDNGGNNNNNNSNNASTQNFFQRIIDWFRNLFKKMFK